MASHWDPRRSTWQPASPSRRKPPARPRRRGLLNRAELQLMLVVGVTLGLVSQLGWIGPLSREAPPTRIAATAPAAAVPAGPLRVIDGDTFDYRGDRIRIADIDTPELRGRCPAERELARRAKARLTVLLSSGSFELARSGRDEDRYGRKLRIVVRDGRSLGNALVAEGLARTWTGRREPWC